MSQAYDDWVPSQEDDEASKASLALSPWIAERAASIKAAHMAARLAESPGVSQKKAAAWRRGENTPHGFSCA